MDTTHVKFDGQGNVDVDASTEAYREAVTLFASAQKTNLESVAGAVETVFDSNPNLKSIQLGTLAGMACNILKPEATAYGETFERVQDYVRNAKDKFEINRGRGGGVSRKAKPAELPAS